MTKIQTAISDHITKKLQGNFEQTELGKFWKKSYFYEQGSLGKYIIN